MVYSTLDCGANARFLCKNMDMHRHLPTGRSPRAGLGIDVLRNSVSHWGMQPRGHYSTLMVSL